MRELRDLSEIFSDPSHTFVIAEAGSNWKVGSYEDDLMMAKKLIDVASKAGADAVKFQTYRSQTVYVENAGQIDYLHNSSGPNINEVFSRLSMPYEMLPELRDYCQKNDVIFMSTPFSVKDAIQVDKLVDIHKIASYEINHVRLLEFLSKTGKPVLISTGASTYNEIDFAVECMKKNHARIGLFQCTSKYPASLDILNLAAIPQMKLRYNVPVGLSDHSIEPLIGPLVAIGMGATFIEKHFTLDRNLPGPDHAFALIPNELEEMVKVIRKADTTKGNGEKTILTQEQELHKFATRSIQAIANISKGEIFQEGINIEVLRPGNQKRGLSARFLFDVLGKKASKNIDSGTGITKNDYE